MISLKAFNNRKIGNGNLIPLVIGLYLILYALDVYDIRLPFNPTTIRTYIYYIVFVIAIAQLISKPRIDKVEIYLFLYAMIIVLGQYLNGLLTLSKAANDLYFPLILFVSRRHFAEGHIDRVRKAISIDCAYAILFFALFIYASFSMRLRYGMYLNSCYYCALLLPFVLCIKKPTARNILVLVCLIPSILALKRGAYLSVIVGVVFYYIAIRKTEDFKNNKKMYIRWAIASAIGIIAVMLYMNQKYQIDMISRLLAASDDGGSGRTDLIKGMIELLGKNNILGALIGHGSFTSSQYLGSSSHNDFLEMLWSYGLLGFIPYILIIISFCKNCKKLKDHRSYYYAPTLACIVEFLICSLVSQLVFVPTYVAFLLLFFALTESQINQTNTNETGEALL